MYLSLLDPAARKQHWPWVLLKSALPVSSGSFCLGFCLSGLLVFTSGREAPSCHLSFGPLTLFYCCNSSNSGTVLSSPKLFQCEFCNSWKQQGARACRARLLFLLQLTNSSTNTSTAQWVAEGRTRNWSCTLRAGVPQTTPGFPPATRTAS